MVSQTPKICTLLITICGYCNLGLTITNIVQSISETAKNEKNLLLKAEDFREKKLKCIMIYYFGNLTIFRKIRPKI